MTLEAGWLKKKKMPLWYDDIWLELCCTEQVVHANVREDHSRRMEQCMQRPWGRSVLGFSGSLMRPLAGEEQGRVRGLVGPAQNCGFLHWVSWEPWRGLGAKEGHKLIEHLKRLTLVTIWKTDTDRQENKQGDPLGGYAASRTCWLPAQPRKHQSQEPGGPTCCQKTRAQSESSSQTSWRCRERRACITILASSETGRTPRSNQYWIHRDLICTCLRTGWASMKWHHLVGLLKVCSRTRSHSHPYRSPGSKAGWPQDSSHRLRLGQERPQFWKMVIGERKESLPQPLMQNNLRLSRCIAKHATEQCKRMLFFLWEK